MRALFACLFLAFCGLSQAAIKTQEIPYHSPDGTRFIGYYAYDDSQQGPRPGVVVVQKAADERSWADMQALFKKLFN
ncbi:Dienelactone hydrolase family protein [Pseudomonas chlororaphis subsp. piscium]|nr:Dienelactone hydrolase family protein [Pseudomonas chlororaphis subsp. piscium]AZC58844.1 Dienelactone hydrolase family protein [Pseudomonas chlororaphis subsp. piscium]AZC65053.1 Dienelactone hydrolase family protein [Pseudomonas chlororaphis subsp. piscium]AZC71294.1 Dienelactone hydrolase family protein [Pseudomonas chlororaphis subsp. piscium]AZC77519.1 Dienelactone hydrolase family protein [Pseudomonas chlororaphis subsp. piscium]